MLLAINPDNAEFYSEEFPMVFTQGQLLYALEQGECDEILIDRELPGHLKIDDLYHFIVSRYPDVKVSVIEKAAVAIQITETQPQTTIIKPAETRFIKANINSFAPLLTILITFVVYFLLTVGGDPHWSEIIIAGVTGAGVVSVPFLK